MTEQESYIAGQESSGIAEGDEVICVRHFSAREGGFDGSGSDGGKRNFVTKKAIGTVSWVSDSGIAVQCGVNYGGRWKFPYFVLEIVKKASSTVPDAKPVDKGDSNMKTQEIYSVAVTENINVKDAETGQIEAVTKKVLYKNSALPAYSAENARVKATAEAVKKAPKANVDEMAVLVRPFCG